MPTPGPTDRHGTPSPRALLAGAIGVWVLASAVFASGLSSEGAFVDEWAYLSQTYYSDLWLAGRRDDPAWLDYPAYDLPPLPKYVFGMALRVAGYPRPGRDAAERWYRDTSTVCGSRGMLDTARWPVVAFGALGCVALYAIGTMSAGPRVGLLAAVFLMLNPLYRLHAHRAMSDVISESLILLALALALWTWGRMLSGRMLVVSWVTASATGIFAGLAALAKLNGALAMIVVIAWAALAMALPRVRLGRKLAVVHAAVLAGITSLLVFVMLNPFLTARPRGPNEPPAARLTQLDRLRLLVNHRVAVSSGQQQLFRHNALTNPTDKLATVAVQGFGRFGPLGPGGRSDSTKRYDRAQDWGAVVWLPLAAAGAGVFFARGRGQLSRDEPPSAWAVLLQAVVSLLVVSAYLPLAWDRYYLSLQPGSALLAAGAVVAAWDRLALALRPRASEG